MSRFLLFLSAIALLRLTVACAQQTEPSKAEEPVHEVLGEQMEVERRIDTITPAVGASFTVEKSSGIDKRFEPVIRRLLNDGWPKELVVERFADKRTVFIPKMTVVKPRSRGTSSGSSAYAWVNTAESAAACREFISRYDSVIAEAEARYGVDRETIAALMRCETRHGQVTGDYHVFSVYASMALMQDSGFLTQSLEGAEATLKGRGLKGGSLRSELDWVRNRASTRSKWAYKELSNLLKIDRAGHTDAMDIYGSWAGAFGWSQFLPSSYLSRAVDGDGDRKINLFNPADAIHSVANYLSKAGYRMGNDASRRKALFNYNNSSAYVQSIMALADRVKKN